VASSSSTKNNKPESDEKSLRLSGDAVKLFSDRDLGAAARNLRQNSMKVQRRFETCLFLFSDYTSSRSKFRELRSTSAVTTKQRSG
jgi:hypothetical protein